MPQSKLSKTDDETDVPKISFEITKSKETSGKMDENVSVPELSSAEVGEGLLLMDMFEEAEQSKAENAFVKGAGDRKKEEIKIREKGREMSGEREKERERERERVKEREKEKKRSKKRKADGGGDEIDEIFGNL